MEPYLVKSKPKYKFQDLVDMTIEEQLLVQNSAPGRPLAFGDYNFDFQFARAIAHAASGASSPGECWIARSLITDGDIESWDAGWRTMGQRLEGLAKEALASGHKRSARDRFMRAYNYYRAAEFFIPPKSPLKKERFQESYDCFQQGLALSTVPIIMHPVPFEGTAMPAYVMEQPNARDRPTIILHTGGDGAAEETYLSGGLYAFSRGYNVVLFEGPGQRTFLHNNPDKPYRYDYETAITPIVDFTLSLPFVNAEKVGMIAMSLGGYTGSRALAFEHRVKAFVCNSPITDFFAYCTSIVKRQVHNMSDEEAISILEKQADTNASTRFLVDHLGWILGGDTVREIMENCQKFRLDGIERQIQCPTLCIFGVSEGTEHYRQFREFTSNLTCPYDTYLFRLESGGDQHCQMNNRVLCAEVMYDWLDEKLGWS